MRFSTASAAILAVGLSAVDAHMVMKEPTPFGKSSLTNSPLLADGSDYPCKQRSGVYDAQGANNVMPLGSTQPLTFTGSAVHGGGSCQVSVTYDKNPSKDSVFKVIHSIVGGCPAKGVQGNLPADPNGSGASQFSFTIPQDLPKGDAVLAWTWFNKIGNREMYMNCAPITITDAQGASKSARDLPAVVRRDQSAFNQLPDMFKANINNGCKTVDSQDVDFPSPGASVEKDGAGAPVPPTGTCGSGSGSGSSSGGNSSSSSTGGSSGSDGSGSGSGSPASSAAPDSSSPPSNPGGVFVPPASSTTAAPAAASSSAPATDPAPASSGSDSGSGSSTPSDGTSAGSANTTGEQTGPCTAEGAFICLPDGKHYQQCGSGHWTVVMPMASGTSCSIQGASLAVEASAQHAKRHLRFSHGHHLRREAGL